MSEIYLFGDSASQGIVLDENDQYRVSRMGCIRLLKRKGYAIRNYAVHGYTVLQGLDTFRYDFSHSSGFSKASWILRKNSESWYPSQTA